jgi:spermidine/putrescine transport system substrate-binding protein
MEVKTMRILYVINVIMILISSVAFAADQKKLVFLNWPDYIHPQIVSSFEKKFGVDIHEMHYETDELKEEMLLANDAQGIDIMVGSGISMLQYVKRKWIDQIPTQELPNLKYIKKRFQTIHPALNNHAVPYLWGTLGIGYRKDKITYLVDSWQQLFRPKQILRGKILMINDSRDTVGAALRLCGYSINSTTPDHYDRVFHLLKFQRGFVKAYSYIDLEGKSPIVTGDVWMAMMYNGDALALRNKNANIDFCIPKEGTNLWIDYLAVLSKSRHKKLAFAFINYIHAPENSAKISMFLKYATPNEAAVQYMTPEHLNNQMIYPPDKILDISEIYQPLPANIIKKRNNIFMDIVHSEVE